MSLPQALYLAMMAVYVFLFALFLRLFVWKYYAETRFWKRRPRLSREILIQQYGEAEKLPFISIFVPARDEVDVIHRTIDHLAALDYPGERYEVIVVTDEKETRRRAREAERAVGEALGALRHPERRGEELTAPARVAVFGLLARFACGAREVARQVDPLPGEALRRLVRDVALDVWMRHGRFDLRAVRRLCAEVAPAARQPKGLSLTVLALALPAVVAYDRLVGPGDSELSLRAARAVARGARSLSRRVLHSLCEVLAAQLVRKVQRLRRSDELESLLEEEFRAAFPTTQDVVAERIAALSGRVASGSAPRVRQVDVPYDFDGRLGGRNTGREVSSTKGRALNYALAFADPRSTIAGFYDAESRPDARVLLYVAWRRLQPRPGGEILQGPIFQVRNFLRMSPLCKLASLYQSLSHDWCLPVLFRRLPFVGGTNVFVDLGLLRRIGGFDHDCLTEDLELGTRAYLRAGAWPEYLPYPSSEQTPPTVLGFYRQRLRWGSGYLQVVDKLRRSPDVPRDRAARLLRTFVWKGHVEWTFYQLACFLPVVSLFLWRWGVVDPSVLPPQVRAALSSMAGVYLAFTFYVYFRYARHVDEPAGPGGAWQRLGAIGQLLAAPIAAFFLPVPYTSALVLHALGRTPRTWVKTPRTRE